MPMPMPMPCQFSIFQSETNHAWIMNNGVTVPPSHQFIDLLDRFVKNLQIFSQILQYICHMVPYCNSFDMAIPVFNIFNTRVYTCTCTGMSSVLEYRYFEYGHTGMQYGYCQYIFGATKSRLRVTGPVPRVPAFYVMLFLDAMMVTGSPRHGILQYLRYR